MDTDKSTANATGLTGFPAEAPAPPLPPVIAVLEARQVVVAGIKSKTGEEHPSKREFSNAECPVVWGRILRDEAHLDKGKSTKLVQSLSNLWGAYRGVSVNPEGVREPPPVWHVTGTPFPKSPADIVGAIRIIERPEWKDDPVLCKAGAGRIEKLGREFDRAVRNGDEDVSLILSNVGKFLRRISYISREEDVVGVSRI
ncbi:hypothetical protein ASPACDRAFT_42331 [Aspergillus aculeatus ATCC 16872]|uniref:SNF2 N-terminal domain-containing protein n=1 Tax=Aspergillus aculeatus (strain ATCC 16872 / CBS 172.66 / WB 5094) TaxID=690307 RepID=A0A1L9WX60_ASPA1|nr:uncharacterized protein ASPACDRAFT_42331 [Aspergillus aculeatus ATCC 16872]OJK00835.1 hypothetical protein ASPACDRAFT_42331 [Aspergillus aculeatus ATCC 16872]